MIKLSNLKPGQTIVLPTGEKVIVESIRFDRGVPTVMMSTPARLVEIQFEWAIDATRLEDTDRKPK